MSTGTAVILDAFVEIGVNTVNSEVNPESILFGMDKLNGMLELWISRSIRFAYTPLAVPGDELGELPDMRNGIVSNLALYLASGFDNGGEIVSPELRNRARLDFSEIKNLYQKIVIPAKIISSTTPMGAGNNRGVLPRTFAGPLRPISG